MKTQKHSSEKELIKLGKYWHEITTIKDQSGKIIHKMVKPLMLGFHWRDLIQVIIGACILSTPILFSEEIWILSQEMNSFKILGIALISISFIALFCYVSTYHGLLHHHFFNFIKRVIVTYSISLLISFLLLFLIDKGYPNVGDWTVILHRMVLISFPASMSAAVTDGLK